MDSDDEMDAMLSEIDAIHKTIQQQTEMAKYRRGFQVMIGLYALGLMAIFYKNQGFIRPISDIRATDLLLVLYTSALVS